jgi:hypothetical protein
LIWTPGDHHAAQSGSRWIERSALDVKDVQSSRKIKHREQNTHVRNKPTSSSAASLTMDGRPRPRPDSAIDEEMFIFNYEHSSNPR